MSSTITWRRGSAARGLAPALARVGPQDKEPLRARATHWWLRPDGDDAASVRLSRGAAVAEALLAAGQRVRVIVRRAEAGAGWRARGAEVAVADLANPLALATALRGG